MYSIDSRLRIKRLLTLFSLNIEISQGKDEWNDSLIIIATQSNNEYDYNCTIHTSHMVRDHLLIHVSS